MLSIYKASAGSGKTFTLTREYLRMLLRMPIYPTEKRLPHTRVLAVTFTKKATAEMKERILRELYILAHTPEKSDYLQDFLSDNDIHLNTLQIQERALLLLVGILQDYTRFSVSTIDGFFQQVIRTFAMEVELSVTYDLSLDNEEIVKQAVDDIFVRIRESRKEDKELVAWILDYIQGKMDDDKTWNPSHSIKSFSMELLKEKLMRKMEAIQLVFSDKGAMNKYRSQLLHICQSAEHKIDDIQQQCLNIFATEEGWNKKLISAFQRAPQKWFYGDLSKNFCNVLNDPNTVYTKSNTTKQQQLHLLNIYTEQLQPLFHELYNLCTGNFARDYITANAILPNLYTMGILQDVALQIETTNRNLGRLPISETNQLIHQIIDGQEAPFIYERIGQHFRHYMIDEFQDTSAMQWENFSPLITESESQNQANLIVGDVKQSIYRFRNSDWHTLTQVPYQFANTILPKMEYNYRTAPEVIQYNETVIQAYGEWVANKVDEISGQPQLSQDIRTMYSMDEMHQKAAKTYEGYFHMQFFEGEKTRDAQAEAMWQQLQAFEQEGIDLSRVAILVRYKKEARAISEFLIDKGYNVQSSEGLLINSHPTIQLIISLLKQEDDTIDPINEAYIRQTVGILTQEQKTNLLHARQLPLYEQVQTLIDVLQLNLQTETVPYLIALQDTIYSFTQNRVADRKSFLEYWDRNCENIKIAAPANSDAIRVMTIHSSKGLEFDIVMIPYFDWAMNDMKNTSIIWCTPNTEPFNTLPLVAVYPNQNLKKSHLANDYIQEVIAQYIDQLNTTYVALTRPRYRLYAYGPKYKSGTITNVGKLVSYLFDKQLNEQNIYCSLKDGQISPAPLPEHKKLDIKTVETKYLSSPINQRLTLRSRSEDDFAKDTPLAIVDLGILMHLWLSHINTWQDAEPALQRLIKQGQVSEYQSHEMKMQLAQLQALIQRENHNDWFSTTYQVLSEQDIITPHGTIQRPDRVMIKKNHAIVIDYKFGHEQPSSHLEQVRDYMALLNQMGYTSEGYIVYSALNTIHTVK